MAKSTKEIMARERRAVEDVFGRGNVDALDEVFASDAVFHMPPFPDIKGLEAYKQSVPATRQSFTDFRFDWDEVICEGNTAVQRYTFHMKFTGKSLMITIPPTGKEVVMKGCVVYHLKNGKVVEFLEYADYLGLFQQMGIVPPIGQK
jgi:predicted ester cyclase